MDINETTTTMGTEVEEYFDGYVICHDNDPPELATCPQSRKKTQTLRYRIKVVAPHYHDVDTGAFVYKGIRMHFERSGSTFSLKLNVKIFSNGQWAYYLQKPIRTENQIFLWDKKSGNWIDATTTTAELEDAYTKYSKKKTAEYGELSYQLKSLLGFSSREIRNYLKSHHLKEARELIFWASTLKENRPSLRRARHAFENAKSAVYLEKCMEIPCKNYNAAKKALEWYLNMQSE